MEFNTLEDAQSALEAIGSGEEVTAELDSTAIETPVETPDTPAIDTPVETAPIETPAESTVAQEVELPVESVKPEDAEKMTYNPNFEYNVKGETKEFDSRLKSAITSPEDEDFIRDLVTKADGMDSFKEKLEESKAKQSEYEGTIATLGERTHTLENFYTNIVKERDNGNHRGACKSMGLSDDDILKTAIEIAGERNLPTEERTKLENDRKMAEQQALQQAQFQQQQMAIANSNATKAQELDDKATEHQRQELQFAISNQHADLMTAMKASNIDLEKEVIATGAFMQQTRAEGQPNVTVAEALKATVDKYSVYVAKPSVPVVSSHTSNRPQPVAIPTIAGGSTAPVATAPKSIEDLKKEYERLNNEHSAMR